jgi:hypothetical protein
MTLNEENLVDEGFSETKSGQILLIACGALAREILAVRDANGWSHMDLKCLPAILHHKPKDITAAVIEAVEKHRENYDKVFVVYADCGTGGLLEAACERLGVEMIAGPHCYSFFEGNEAFDARDEITAFYLTDFLVRQFDAFVTKPLGLDRHPQLRDMYFEHYEKVVYQAQIVDPDLEAKAKECAKFLRLPYEYRYTGYGDLETALSDQA